MPTGTPIRDVGEQLRAAAARVLLRGGAGALTSRAVTTEAGLAKGILHRHFIDFDAFLATLVLARLERLDTISAELRGHAGAGELAANVAHALLDALDPTAVAVVALVCARRPLRERLRLTTPTGVPILAETVTLIATYLTAERGLGRVAIGSDVDALAPALVGGAHLLAAGGETDHCTLCELARTILGASVRSGAAGPARA